MITMKVGRGELEVSNDGLWNLYSVVRVEEKGVGDKLYWTRVDWRSQ